MSSRKLKAHPDHLFHRTIQFQDGEKWPHEARILTITANGETTTVRVKGKPKTPFETPFDIKLPCPIQLLAGRPDGDTLVSLNDGWGRIVIIYSAERSNSRL